MQVRHSRQSIEELLRTQRTGVDLCWRAQGERSARRRSKHYVRGDKVLLSGPPGGKEHSPAATGSRREGSPRPPLPQPPPLLGAHPREPSQARPQAPRQRQRPGANPLRHRHHHRHRLLPLQRRNRTWRPQRRPPVPRPRPRRRRGCRVGQRQLGRTPERTGLG